MRLKLHFERAQWLIGTTQASLTDLTRAMQYSEVFVFLVENASGEQDRLQYQSFINMGTVQRFEIVDQLEQSSKSN